jgi:hypothetical protein
MPQAGRLLRARPAAVRELWVWLVVIVVSVVPTVARYPRRYWFYDEWSIIDRVQSGGNGWGAIFDSFNGHLVAVSYLTYRAQLAVSDLDDRYVVYGVFVASLVAIHLALAVLFRTAGVPALPSVLAGGVLTYLGRGSQSAVFEVQLSFNGATAGAVAAVAIALGPGSMRRAIASAALVVGALFFDSGVAAIALLPLIVLTAGRWRWWQTALAVGPGTALAGWWTVASGSRPSAPSTLADQAEVAARLLVDGLGAMSSSSWPASPSPSPSGPASAAASMPRWSASCWPAWLRRSLSPSLSPKNGAGSSRAASAITTATSRWWRPGRRWACSRRPGPSRSPIPATAGPGRRRPAES